MSSNKPRGLYDLVIALLKSTSEQMSDSELRSRAEPVIAGLWETARRLLVRQREVPDARRVGAAVAEALWNAANYNPNNGSLDGYLHRILERVLDPHYPRTTPSRGELTRAEHSLQSAHRPFGPGHDELADRINEARKARLEADLQELLNDRESNSSHRQTAPSVPMTTQRAAQAWLESSNRESASEKAASLMSALRASDGGKVTAKQVQAALAKHEGERPLAFDPEGTARDAEEVVYFKQVMAALSRRTRRALMLHCESEPWFQIAIDDLLIEQAEGVAWDGNPLGPSKKG